MIGKKVRTAIIAEVKRLGGEFPTIHGYGMILKSLLIELDRTMMNDTLEEDYETVKPKPVIKAIPKPVVEAKPVTVKKTVKKKDKK